MNPDDRIVDYMESKTCPDKMDDPCSHFREGLCTLSKYFTCIETESQDPNPKPKPKSKPKTHPKEGTLIDPSVLATPSVASRSSIVLSYSQIQDFAHCHRKWWWSRRIELIDPSWSALKGQCGHEILQYIHTSEQPEFSGINAIVDKYQDLLSPSSSTLNPTLEVLKALGWAYLEIYGEKLFKGKAEVYWEAEGLHGYIDMVQYEGKE